MSDVITTEPAAGWYQDPSDPAAMRWWNGAEWTTHVQPLVAPVPSPQSGIASTPTETALAASLPFSAPATPADAPRWTSNYSDDELAVYTSRGVKSTAATATPKTSMTADGRTFISWDQDGDGVPDPPPPMGRAWALGALPLVAAALLLLFAGLAAIRAVPAWAIYAADIPLLLSLPLSIADGVQLRRRGYPAPGYGWAILLGPVGHLGRRISLLTGAGRGVGPLVLHLVGSAIFGVAFALALLPTLLAHTPPASGADPTVALTQKSIAETLQTDLMAKGQNLTVECSDPATSIAAGSTFGCVGTAADGKISDIAVTIDAKQQLAYQVTPRP